MSRPRLSLRFALALLGTAGACYEAAPVGPTPAEPTPSEPVPARIELIGLPSHMVLGEEVGISVERVDTAGGREKLERPLLHLGGEGLELTRLGLRAVTPGSAWVRAEDPETGFETTADVSVTAPAPIVDLIIRSAATRLPVGASETLRAFAVRADGGELDVSEDVTWACADPAIRMRGNRAYATEIGEAEIRIDAPWGASATAVLTVEEVRLAGLELELESPLLESGERTTARAWGAFADGRRFDLSESVEWSSSAPEVVSVDGGEISALRKGAARLAARDPRSGLRSPPLEIFVDLVPVKRSWSGLRRVDGTDDYAIEVAAFELEADTPRKDGQVWATTLTVGFRKTAGSCSAPEPGLAYHDETNLMLVGPGGREVVLAEPGTWAGLAATETVQVRFSDDASARPSGVPSSGSFRPTEPLAGLVGGELAGRWTLRAGDRRAGEPLCVSSLSIEWLVQW